MSEIESYARPGSPPSEKAWTVLVFMVPADDLERFALDDIDEMKSVTPADQFNLAVQVYRPAGSDLFEVVNGQEQFESDPPIESIQASLKRFLDWGCARFPSTYTMLVLWGHSYGVGLDLFSPRQDLRGAREQPGPRTVVPRPPLRELFNGNGHVEQRTDNPTRLSIRGLAGILEDARGKSAEPKIDLLGLDSCYMSSAEIAYQLRNSARYMVASESWIREEGWNYSNAFGALANDPTIKPADLGQAIVKGTSSTATQNIAVLDLSRAEKLAERSTACIASLTRLVQQDADARRAMQLCFEKVGFLKVRQFLDLPDLISKLTGDFDELKAQLDPLRKEARGLILKDADAPEDRGKLHGLSIFYPFVDAAISFGTATDSGEVNAVVDDTEYAQLAFVAETKWMAFLRALNPEQGTETP
jgi:hypothetical protein